VKDERAEPARPVDPAGESAAVGERDAKAQSASPEGTETKPPEGTETASSPPTAPPPPATARVGLPGRTEPAPVTGRVPLEVARRIVELAEDKKAADIVLLELGALTTIADYFVICSGGSERQLDAIADAIVEGLAAEGTEPIGREGTAASHWILLDYGAVIVHVLAPPERDYYQLERHWSQARTILRVQ